MSEPMDSRGRRGGRPIRLWIAGAAAGTLVAVSLAPPTGWIARGQIGALLGLGGTPMGRTLSNLGVSGIVSPGAPDRKAILAAHPRDFPLHLAAAMEAAGERRRELNARPAPPSKPYSIAKDVRALADRFGEEPGLYATALRLDTLGLVRISRRDTAELSGDKPEAAPNRKDPDPADLAAFDQDAATGERLEPDNAVFPMFRAVGYYAANRDREAIEAIERAARCARWDEHLSDEVTGKWRLAETETGGRSAIHRAALAAGILFPHLAQFRNATRLATLQAMRLEQDGKPAEGARIRDALMRVGDLMRVQATSLIGNLVGIADTHIALGRPGGAPAIKVRTDVGSGMAARERDETAQRRIAALEDYWKRNGMGDETAAMRARCEAGIAVRRQVSRMVDASPFNESTIVRLAALWGGGTILLANVWWLLVAGGIASVAAARRRAGFRERMPRSGPYVLAVAGILFAAVCISVALHLGRFVEGMGQVASAMRGLEGGGSPSLDSHLTVILTALGFAVPVLVGILAAIVSVVRRVPLRVGMAQGFSRAGLPLAGLLLLVFCGLCVATARAEERLNTGLEQTLKHEGRYLSRLTGQEWPGPVE